MVAAATNKGEVTLAESYARCVAETKEKAKNFHYAFQVLPKDRYEGICALYAFARLADDFSDDEPDAEKAIAAARRWRAGLDAALNGDPSVHPVFPAVADTVKKRGIDPEYLRELIAGTEMDASVKRFETWKETRHYCYLVASVVGLMTIHVFGFEGQGTHQAKKCIELAERTGIAFQMTNILRDVKEDAGRDRIYLPAEDLNKFGVSELDILAGKDSPAFRELVKFETERAKEHYQAGVELVPLIEAESRPAMRVLVSIYQRLLEEIERRNYDVLSKRVSLSTFEKMKIASQLLLKR